LTHREAGAGGTAGNNIRRDASPIHLSKENTMLPGERLPYSTVSRRPPIRLPDGVKLVLWPVLALEHWDITRPMARMVISPPQGQAQQPDHPNWSWHEYGMRVGFWRLRKMFDRLGVRPTVTLNARSCESYPEAIRACLDSGWELNAHSYDQQPMHKLEDQRGVIEKSLDIIERFSGKRPRGWFGPGLTQTFDTLDHLSECGIEYIGDWACDDEPVTLKTRHKDVVALPYNFELHDIVTMALQHHPSAELHTRSLAYFECLYAEAAERPKIMSIAHHPYLSGSPHRFADVERTYVDLLARPGVVCWDGEQILDWYLGALRGG
jgi:peptidoglycan/xylan/chitin deacetylase (PgdA/CDA1 family)